MSESKAQFYAALYRSGRLTAGQIGNAVAKGWISQPEADDILSDDILQNPETD